MLAVSLNGRWSVRKNGRGRALKATVPGDIYADLLAAKEIPDPFYRDNELGLQWIGENNWTYARDFTVPKELLARRHILLRCEGLDTFAKVLINGHTIAQTDNMFRTWEWDVKHVLKPGRNAVRIEFTSVLPYIAKKMKEHPAWGCMPPLAANPGWVRKEQCNFGWDWGIKAVTCGIWRDITLIAFDAGRLTDVRITQKHQANSVELNISSVIDGAGRGLRARIAILDNKKMIGAVMGERRGRRFVADLSIRNPKLWWPNNMGKQPLYEVQVDLIDSEGVVIDSVEKRIGLRTLELDRHSDKWGQSFQFKVNGRPFFAKGANWIPIDAVLARRTRQRYRDLVKDAAAANMNMLRVWGGGIYEDDSFYDACDELGVCVWQDFMFACSAYPTFDDDFMANVKAEARDAVKRLRHHACMALWCGNNELEMMNVSEAGWKEGMMPWKDYRKLFDHLLPRQVRELSPDIAYWPSSPHSPTGERKKHRSHLCGDAHLWIICGADALEKAASCNHRFVSEFGFQSFPEPKTTLAFTGPEDRTINSRIMEHHQRAPGGNMGIMQRVMNYLPMPAGFENTIWSSQVMAGLAAKTVCEHFRRNMPRTMGTLIWQINDSWPVASWSSIDFHGRWKAMHYMARHFFDPVLVSGVHNQDRNTIEIYLTSDRHDALSARVSWAVTDCAGSVLLSGHEMLKTRRNGTCRVKALALKSLTHRHPAGNLLVWLEARVKNGPVRRNMVMLTKPKYLELDRRPEVHSKVRQQPDGSFALEVSALKPALWTWIEIQGVDAKLSDNFFHLRPGLTERITAYPAKTVTLRDIRKGLTLRSIVDTV